MISDRPPQRPRMSPRTWWIMLGVVVLFNVIFYYGSFGTTSSTKGAQTSISYSTFIAQARADNVATASISEDAANGDFRKPYKTGGKPWASSTARVF